MSTNNRHTGWEENKGLTNEQVERFHRDGFIGPLGRFASEELLESVCCDVQNVVQNPSEHPLYGRYSVRDWHLISKNIEVLITHPVLIRALKSLAGDDLVIWRSKIFHKKSHENGTGWHQEWGDFNGEEIGNRKPSLKPQLRGDNWWNVTVWIALTDIELECAPLRFIRGSHRQQYPKTMVPLSKSEFWSDPFVDCQTVEHIVSKALHRTLVLDIDTTTLFEGYDFRGKSFQDVKDYAQYELDKHPAKKTLGIKEESEDIVILPMKRGEFIIFTERTMHGSLPNISAQERFAINFRVTSSGTDIYPSRHNDDFVDGSNVDISQHTNLLITGNDLSQGRNKYR